jgi:hypothetical protein
MVSFADVAFPAFVRHFLRKGANESDLWPLALWDGHFTPLAHSILVDEILFPFLKQQMVPRPSEAGFKEHPPSNADTNPYGSADVRLYPRSSQETRIEVKRWTSWGLEESHNSLKAIAKSDDSGSWSFLQLKKLKDDKHCCFGSTTPSSSSFFDFTTPSACSTLSPSSRSKGREGDHNNCSLVMQYLHSWNTSYVGDAVCHLSYQKKQQSQISTIKLISNLHDGQPLHHTIPRSSFIASNLKGKQNYRLQCLKSNDRRLSCVTSISIFLQV